MKGWAGMGFRPKHAGEHSEDPVSAGLFQLQVPVSGSGRT